MDAARTIRCILPLLALLQLTGCSWTQPYSSAPTTVGGHAAAIALDMQGTPYRYGGATPSGFDCSGLVYYSYNKAGQTVPRTSKAQYSAARRISLNDALRGDLLFFASGRSVDHVAIYLGDGRFVHAPQRGRSVETGRLSDDWYRKNFVTAGRL